MWNVDMWWNNFCIYIYMKRVGFDCCGFALSLKGRYLWALSCLNSGFWYWPKAFKQSDQHAIDENGTAAVPTFVIAGHSINI